MNSISHAPVALFVFNRPWHLRQCVEALKRNRLSPETKLIVYSDGAARESDKTKVADVRSYVKALRGFESLDVIERDRNYGVAESIIAGVSEVVDRFGEVIVLEDDLRISPHFLQFMNHGLAFYRGNDKVISIHGYIYPIKGSLTETFFIRGADCWGWATWKRGWDLFENDGKKLLADLRQKNLQHQFDLDGTYPYTQMLQDQVEGKIDSWAIRWYASAFLNGKLTLYPGRSLVQNIGMDRSGRHSGKSDLLEVDLVQTPVVVKEIPVEENRHVRQQVEEFMRTLGPGPLRKMGRFVRALPARLASRPRR